MQDTLQLKINIKIRPVEMFWRGHFYVQYFAHRSILKPRKLLEWQKMFLSMNQQPDAIPRNIGDLSSQSACAWLNRFHHIGRVFEGEGKLRRKGFSLVNLPS